MPSTVFLSTREGKNDGGTYNNAEFNDRKGGGEYPATSITWPDSHLLETTIPKVSDPTYFTQNESLFEDGYDTDGENGPCVETPPKQEDMDDEENDDETDAVPFQTGPPPSQLVPLESKKANVINDAYNGVFINMN